MLVLVLYLKLHQPNPTHPIPSQPNPSHPSSIQSSPTWVPSDLMTDGSTGAAWKYPLVTEYRLEATVDEPTSLRPTRRAYEPTGLTSHESMTEPDSKPKPPRTLLCARLRSCRLVSLSALSLSFSFSFSSSSSSSLFLSLLPSKQTVLACSFVANRPSAPAPTR